MIIRRIPNTPINSNCFVLHEQNGKECIIIDPGSDDNSKLMTYLTHYNLLPTKIILTHEHFDHIWGIIELNNHFLFDLICNNVCSNAIKNPKMNLSFFHNQEGFAIVNQVTTVEYLNHEFIWNGRQFKFFQTPGHSEGSISIQLDDLLFCGDLLIQDEKTVTKLPGGSLNKFKQTTFKLKTELSPETIIHSGHGECFFLKDYYNYSEL